MPVIRVQLKLCGTALVIEVWDASSQPPVLQQDQDAEHGRGLVIVHAQSERWGTTYLPKTGGKVVWSEIALRRSDALSATRLQPIVPAQPTSRPSTMSAAA